MLVFIAYAPPAPPPPAVEVLEVPDPAFVTLPPAPPPPQHSTVTVVTPAGQFQVPDAVKVVVAAQVALLLKTTASSIVTHRHLKKAENG
jgi:hypothetical protein